MLKTIFTPATLIACSILLSLSNAAVTLTERSLIARAGCGADIGSCPPGSCCNKQGQCGTDHTFCAGAGNCQLEYSDSCDAQKMPTGPSLLSLARPQIGSVPYGQVITSCTKPGSIALAFDDGPARNYTAKVLDLLKSYGMKATFFVTGHDFAQPIDDPKAEYGPVLLRMHAEGHQIGHHTWTHENLTTLNSTLFDNQIHYNELALRNVLGFIPTYLRPPYLSCKGDCPSRLLDKGYHIITANLDTKDFDNNSPDLIQTSKDAFVQYMQQNVTASTSVTLTLNHDIRLQTAYNLTDFMLDYIVKNNLPKSITVGDCLNDPPENWYRDAGGIPPNTTTSGSGGSSKPGKSSSSMLRADRSTLAQISVSLGVVGAFLL